MGKVQPPKGMRDILPEDFLLRDSLIAVIRSVYESYGYVSIDTPVPERLEYLSEKAGDDTEQLMFKILKRGAKLAADSGEAPADMAMRYDLTVSLCRYYATNHHLLPAVFRRYQIAPVWRADRPQHGRFREFYQCDVDVIGEKGSLPECEVILATTEALGKLGLEGHFVKLSDRRLLPTIFRGMGLTDDKARRAMVSVDKLDKLPVEKVLVESASYLSDEENRQFEPFLRDITCDADLPLEAAALGQWGGRCADEVEPILANLRAIRDVIGEVRPDSIRLRFWPSLARGMAYYTGPIFEIWDGQSPFSLAGGGRYDNLIGKFLGQTIPACGFSIGFERILTVMKERGTGQQSRTKARVLIALRDKSGDAAGLRIAQQLRDAGISTEVHPFTSKIAKQFKHAEDLSIPWVVVPHGPEADGQDYELINMSDRNREKAPWPEILALLHERLAT